MRLSSAYTAETNKINNLANSIGHAICLWATISHCTSTSTLNSCPRAVSRQGGLSVSSRDDLRIHWVSKRESTGIIVLERVCFLEPFQNVGIEASPQAGHGFPAIQGDRMRA
jgi:hypothetical protein